MTVTSVSFLLFTAVLLIVYYRVPGKLQWTVLLAASGGFYLWAGAEYLGFLLFTILTTYGCTMWMARNNTRREARLAQLPQAEKRACRAAVKGKNRAILALCLSSNFAALFLCKACLTEPLRTMVSGSRVSFLSLGLPLGISFYMFQSMGYVTDVYRETVKAERNPGKLALFTAYFPQLVQGPISRFSQLAPQLLRPHRFDGKQVSFGLQRMLWGYFKKLVIADRIAVAVAALKAPEYTGAAFLVLSVFYAVQIYADFTGGMDIALGLSQALGIGLPENFTRPFFSKNIAVYWRRWHITLGTWMKDYVFYPLSVSAPLRKLSRSARRKFGSFGKRLPVYIASAVTWSVTGIWHGLTPNFLVWGLLNCLVIAMSEELTPLYARFHNRFSFKEKRWYGWFEVLRTFLLMNLIRTCDLFPSVMEYFRRTGSLLTAFHPHILWDGTLMQLGLSGLDYGILAAGITLMFTVSLVQEKKGCIRELLWQGGPMLRYALTFALLLTVLLMGNYGIGYQASNFLYNQF